MLSSDAQNLSAARALLDEGLNRLKHVAHRPTTMRTGSKPSPRLRIFRSVLRKDAEDISNLDGVQEAEVGCIPHS
jgi:hypothetical protein